MILHRDARTDHLLDALADVLEAPVPGRDAIEPEWLIVQSRAMERWLTQGLAARLGILANAKFAYPAQAIDDLMVRLGIAEHERLRFGPRRLAWAVAARLVAPIDPALGPLAAYLGTDAEARGRLPLARRIADVFDDYVVHRPAMLRAWQDGDDAYAARHGVPPRDDDAWQPALWRMLMADLGDAHLAAMAEKLPAALAGRGSPRGALPARLCVVMPTTLPPLHVWILRQLAKRIEVHVFVATPSPARWEAVAGWLDRDDHDALRTEAPHQDGSVGAITARSAAEERPPPAAHPLVAANHRVADDLQRLLHGEGDPQPREAGRGSATFTSEISGGRSSASTLLGALQDDVRRDARRGDGERLSWDPGDRSIELHACHGPQREVEVLRDRLLAAFAADPGLQPDDVLVMAPDMAAYAPYVAAVFGVPAGAPGFIPFRVADRGIATESAVFGALEAVLDVLDGRFGATAVLDLLALELVAERFGLGPEAPESLRRWVGDAAIRWAVDAGHRASYGLPEDAANTWREGLDRLLLGWAMPDDGPPWAGALPRGTFAAADAELLGRVAEAIEVLDGLRGRVTGQRTMAGWSDALGGVLEATVAESWRNAEEHAAVRDALEELRRYAEDGAYTAPLPLSVVRGLLTSRLGEGDEVRAYLTGALTFCALLPLRGVPHRVIALLGMSDDAFPRAAHADGFDLIARAPRIGDRNQRRADRQLFLEALMAAGERLIVTWVGRSMADDAERPPSVVVAELLDVLDGMLAVGVEGGARERLVVEHPRQPFSPRNYDGEDARVASYDAVFLPPPDVAEFARPFVSGPLAPNAEEEGEAIDPDPMDSPGGLQGRATTPVNGPMPLDLDGLIGFLENPCRAFVRLRLGLYLDQPDAASADREPLVLDKLEEWGLGARLLVDETGDLGAARRRERAGGQLPPGTLGELAFVEVAEKVSRVRAAVAGQGAAPVAGEARSIDIVVAGQRITGQVDGAGPEGVMAAQFGAIRPKHKLALWVRHLALCAAADAAGGPVQRSRLVGRDGKVVAFGPIDGAADRLGDLVRWWRMGQALPLPLLPTASHAYAEAMANGKGERAARRAADAAWSSPGWGGGPPRGDGDDLYVRQVYGGIDPFGIDTRPEELPMLAADFEAVALAVWDPLLAAARAPGGDE